MKRLGIYYQASMALTTLGWILIIGFPTSDFTDKAVVGIVAALCISYGYILFFYKGDKSKSYPKGSFKSFQGVFNLFQNPKGVFAGWLHFLAFDLMIGLYIKNDSIENGLTFWWIIPSLILTLMLGPLGLLSYFIIKFVVVG